MKLPLLNKNKTQNSTAEIVEDYLVLSLLDAQEPKVWRMALEKIGTAAFEIKKEKEGSITKLILKPKKGTAEIIAVYDNQDQALNALSAASQALQRVPAKEKKAKLSAPNVAANANTTTGQNPKQGNKWLLALLGVIVVITLYYYLVTLIPEKQYGFEAMGTGTTTNTTQPAQGATGVPIDADSFLNGL